MKITRLLILLFLTAAWTASQAQFSDSEWKIYTLDASVGKDVTISFDMASIKYVYALNQKGKMKRLEIDDNAYSSFWSKEQKYHVHGYSSYKGNEYLKISTGQETFFLLVDGFMQAVFPSRMKNLAAIDSILARCNREFIYLKSTSFSRYRTHKVDANAIPMVADCAYRMRWTGYDFSGDKLRLKGSLTDGKELRPFCEVTASSIYRFDFYTESEITEIYQKKELQKQQDIAEDGMLHAYSVTYAVTGTELKAGDTIYMFSKTQGWCDGEIETLKSSDFSYNLKPVDVPNGGTAKTYNAYTSYLDRRGDEGFQVRMENARIADSLALERVFTQLKNLIREVDSIKDEWNKKTIFLIGKEYSFPEYGSDFGLELKFYNCFKKTIKYIQFETKAYNSVGDLQRDYFGKSLSKGKCIGPIEPGDTGTYDFDELYYDANDVISRVCVTKVIFTFMDNSTVTYTDINKHISAAVFNKPY